MTAHLIQVYDGAVGKANKPGRGPEWAEPRPDAPGPQEGAQRPWWRRMFGG